MAEKYGFKLFTTRGGVEDDYNKQAKNLSGLFNPSQSEARKYIEGSTKDMENQLRKDYKTAGAIGAQKAGEMAARTGLSGTQLGAMTSGIMKSSSDDALRAIQSMTAEQKGRLAQLIAGIEGQKRETLSQNEIAKLAAMHDVGTVGEKLVQMLVSGAVGGITPAATAGGKLRWDWLKGLLAASGNPSAQGGQ